MQIICDCGEEMDLVNLEPGQDSNFVLFECPSCGAGLSGEHRLDSDEEDDEEDED